MRRLHLDTRGLDTITCTVCQNPAGYQVTYSVEEIEPDLVTTIVQGRAGYWCAEHIEDGSPERLARGLAARHLEATT